VAILLATLTVNALMPIKLEHTLLATAANISRLRVSLMPTP